MATDFRRVLEALAAEKVRFVLIGGLAMIAHGSTRLTIDLDICYERSNDNVVRLCRALAPMHPRLRDFPPELPFFWDAQTVRSGLNFTLATDAGSVDLLGEVPGVGDYAAAARDAARVELYGREVDILSLDALERAKRAAGRAKDLMDLAEIAVIRRKGGG